MSLKNGYIPSWRSDDDLFLKKPDEAIVFQLLIKQAHYKLEPFISKIEGAIYKGKGIKREAYSQEWSIQRGDILTSKQKIRERWGYSNPTIERILKSLQLKGLIGVLLEDPALVIRIINYDYFTWTGLEEERFPHNRGVCQMSQGGVTDVIGGYDESHTGVCQMSQGGVTDVIQCNNLPNTHPKNISNNQSNSPLPPNGGKNENGSLGVNLISIGRGRRRREQPAISNAQQKRVIIPPVRLYRRTMSTHPHLAQLGQIALSCTYSNEQGEDGCVCGMGREKCDKIPLDEVPF